MHIITMTVIKHLYIVSVHMCVYVCVYIYACIYVCLCVWLVKICHHFLQIIKNTFLLLDWNLEEYLTLAFGTD